MPAAYADTSLTFRHLLTHSSGLPHRGSATSAPLWKEGKLNLQFRPGTSYHYSTGAFGILVELAEEVAGKTFQELLQEVIAKPIEARSFQIPGAMGAGWGISSNIKDMALFTVGVMNNVYLPENMLYKQVLHSDNSARTYGLGWAVANEGSEEVMASHSGSNGRQKAFLLMKPKRKISLVILAKKLTVEGGPGSLAHELFSLLEKTD